MPSQPPHLAAGVRYAGVCLLVVLTACLSAATGTAHGKAPFGFIGMNAEDVYAGDDAYQDRMFTMMQQAGVTVVRQNFRWGYSEPARGVYDFTNLDRYVLAASRHGIRVLPLLYGETTWGSSRPPGKEDERCAYPPQDDGDFAAWSQRVAQRYGRGGEFWMLHPEYAHQQITAYEIWNEPNLKTFWKCKPDAYAYVRLARDAANAIRQADPDASIISAGAPVITKHPGEYLRQMFKAGARTVFDAIALHPYQPSTAKLMENLQDARDIIDEYGATNWSMVVTEFGWATAGPPTQNRTVTESKAATLLKNGLVKMGEQRKKLKLRSACYYTWSDLAVPPGGKDFWGLHTGIVRLDTSAKPTLQSLTAAAREID